MIEIAGLTKTYGSARGIEDVSFQAPSGSITGFLGPNGAGKTTTLRVLLGLARADRGVALFDGVQYESLPSPRQSVGAVLDPGFHPRRTGRNHLRVIAQAAGLGKDGVDAVLESVELLPAAGRAVGGYSTGMKQRLALASALLGDPDTLVLDEPGNGLDPAGMAWLRDLLTGWAGEGRTVLFSSHALSEVALVADTVAIIDQGRIVRNGTLAEVIGDHRTVLVRTAQRDELAELLGARGWDVRDEGPDGLHISGASLGEVGALAARAGIALTELSSDAGTEQLEAAFLEMTGQGGLR